MAVWYVSPTDVSLITTLAIEIIEALATAPETFGASH